MKELASHDGASADVVLSDVAKPSNAFSFNVHAVCLIPATCVQPGHNKRKTSLLNLPRESVEDVLSRLPSARDLVCVMASCKTLRDYVLASKLCVSLRHSLLSTECPWRMTHQEVQDIAHRPVASLQSHLTSVIHALPSITHLDISHTPVVDAHIELAVAKLVSLRTLIADHCRKLSPDVPCSLPLQQPVGSPSPTAAGIVHLSLQRCFQLSLHTLHFFLRSCRVPNSSLKALALSHIDLQHWSKYWSKYTHDSPPTYMLAPEASSYAVPPPAVFSQVSTSSLLLLALHCCSRMNAAALRGIAQAAPQLQMLLLGGCEFTNCAAEQGASPVLDAVAAVVASLHLQAQASARALASSLSSRHGTCLPLSLVLSAAIARGRKRLQHKSTTVPNDETSQEAPFMAEAIGMLTSAQVAAVAAQAEVALLLPELSVLEATHMPFGASELLRQTLKSAEWWQIAHHDMHRLGRQKQGVDVWDFCVLEDVVRASAALTSSSEVNTAHALAVRAAASCSSAARLTPLHVAASDGDAELASILLDVGAQIDSRTKSGETALFCACEAGHASVVKVLLAAGADLWIGTASGENPLYISALRGHEQVLRVLLQHCKRHGMLWTKGELYGDGWTPLMSATVAGHASLVKLLLTLAGDRVRELAAAQNKYGSTALHLAAYRGSVPMIKLLLRHHIQSLLTWRDARGFTPAQIARKHSHFAAEALLARKSAAVMAY